MSEIYTETLNESQLTIRLHFQPREIRINLSTHRKHKITNKYIWSKWPVMWNKRFVSFLDFRYFLMFQRYFRNA